MNKSFLAITLVLFVVGAVPLSRPGAGWFWELGNGLGFAALVAMLYLLIDTRRGGKVRTHQLVGYLALGYLAAHILWFLAGDPIAIEYAKPGASWSMWSAWLALLMLLVLVVSSLPNLRPANYHDHLGFRRWHRVLTMVLLAATVHHIAGSGFYVFHPLQWLSLMALSIFLLWLPLHRNRGLRPVQLVPAVAVTAVAIALFVGAKFLLQ